MDLDSKRGVSIDMRMRRASGTHAMLADLIMGIALITIALTVALLLGNVLHDDTEIMTDTSRDMFSSAVQSQDGWKDQFIMGRGYYFEKAKSYDRESQSSATLSV